MMCGWRPGGGLVVWCRRGVGASLQDVSSRRCGEAGLGAGGALQPRVLTMGESKCKSSAHAGNLQDQEAATAVVVNGCND